MFLFSYPVSSHIGFAKVSASIRIAATWGLLWGMSLSCLQTTSGEEKGTAARPNIVLVMADDQGWGDMAYNGHPDLKTPHFDRFAAEGIRFDRFYAAAPVCSPTRTSVMSGRTPLRSGTFSWGFSLRPDEISIAELLRPAGYRTGHFGKWHLGSVQAGSPVSPGEQGFDKWISAYNFFDNDPILSHQGRAVQHQGESALITVDATLEFIRECANEKVPFLAVVWFGSPHAPHQALADDRAAYASAPAKLQNFYGEITAMDRAFGKLRDQIKEMGLRDNTILWYCSDNGGLPGVGSTGGRGNKGQIYEGGLRVPAIFEWPGKIKQPAVVAAPCVTSDIFPTIASLVSVALPAGRPLDGIDVSPLMRGETSERSRPIGFWQYPQGGLSTPSDASMKELLQVQAKEKEPISKQWWPDQEFMNKKYEPNDRRGHAAWLSWPWKLHRIEGKKDKGGNWELYQLADDPEEKKNLVEEKPEEVAKLKQELDAWQASVIASLNGADYSQP